MRQFILLVVVCGVLAWTNPDEAAHRRALYTAAAAAAGSGETLSRIAGDAAENLKVIPYKYDNYYLGSTMTLDGKIKSVGLLTKVWLR